MFGNTGSAEAAGAAFAGRHSIWRRAIAAMGCLLFVTGAGMGVASLSPLFGTARPATAAPPAAATPTPTATSVAGGGSVTRSATGGGNGSLRGDGPVKGVAFTMAVPSVGYNATVFEGVQTQQLDRGPGHYPETAWPGRAGNVAIAAHNTYWLAFGKLRPGDHVIIKTRYLKVTYEITGSRVVGPRDTSVLAQTPEHQLTLTTCYPLWAGALATDRLVFRGIEVSSEILGSGT